MTENRPGPAPAPGSAARPAPTSAAGPASRSAAASGSAAATGSTAASGSAGITVGRARTGDVRAIRRLIDLYANERRLLSKATVALYEDVQEFRVARAGDEVVGCGALHVMWEDLAEVRTVAVDPGWRGRRIGHRIVTELIGTARELGVARVFCLTFETAFFGSFGFVEIDGAPVPPRVYEELLRSYDEGVAEFLGLERVKPNTLGNSRMLLRLEDS